MPIENQVYRNITNQGALNHLLDNLGPQQKAVAVLVGDRQWGIRVVDAPNAVVRLIHSLTGQTRREQRRLEDFRSQLPAAPSAPTDSTPAVDPLASTEMTTSAAPEPGMVRLERARQALQDNGLTPESFVDLVTKWMSMGKDFSPHQLSQVYQLALFDGFPAKVQRRYLFEVITALPGIDKDVGEMVEAWRTGDAAKLATLMNAEEDDPAMVEALLVRRNKAWAQWIRARLDQPGTAFIAVGAGHLGGEGSVQDQLKALGVESARVQ